MFRKATQLCLRSLSKQTMVKPVTASRNLSNSFVRFNEFGSFLKEEVRLEKEGLVSVLHNFLIDFYEKLELDTNKSFSDFVASNSFHIDRQSIWQLLELRRYQWTRGIHIRQLVFPLNCPLRIREQTPTEGEAGGCTM